MFSILHLYILRNFNDMIVIAEDVEMSEKVSTGAQQPAQPPQQAGSQQAQGKQQGKGKTSRRKG